MSLICIKIEVFRSGFYPSRLYVVSTRIRGPCPNICTVKANQQPKSYGHAVTTAFQAITIYTAFHKYIVTNEKLHVIKCVNLLSTRHVIPAIAHYVNASRSRGEQERSFCQSMKHCWSAHASFDIAEMLKFQIIRAKTTRNSAIPMFCPAQSRPPTEKGRIASRLSRA